MRVVAGSPPLINVESDHDLDRLVENMHRTGYYDSAYFAAHSGYQPGRLGANFWFLAEMTRFLRPRRVFECGCGRGDVLALLARTGVEVSGVDSSDAAVAMAWPEVRPTLCHGDLGSVCRSLAESHERYDVIVGFDIWEHLHPRHLRDAVSAMVSASTDDALFFFVVPAFGRDHVFGEVFSPVNADMAKDFASGKPSAWMIAERVEPPIPVAGHLVWADAKWWQALFELAGLRRQEAIELKLHRWFDRWLPESNRSFFIFSRDTGAAIARATAVGKQSFPAVSFARMVGELARAAKNGTVQERAVRILLKRLFPRPAVLASRMASALKRTVSR